MSGSDASAAGAGLIAGYDVGPYFDEMLEPDGRPRPHYRALYDRLSAMSDDGLEERVHTVNAFFLVQGIGFTVYGDEEGTDRNFPFDLIPRIVPADGWAHVEHCLTQRVRALNLLLGDAGAPGALRQRLSLRAGKRWRGRVARVGRRPRRRRALALARPDARHGADRGARPCRRRPRLRRRASVARRLQGQRGREAGGGGHDPRAVIVFPNWTTPPKGA